MTKIRMLIATVALMASACAAPATTTTTTAAPATTTTTTAAATTTTSTSTTLPPAIAPPSTIDVSVRAAVLRTVLDRDGYGYMVDGVPDVVIDEVGKQTCAMAQQSATRAGFVAAAVIAAAGTYTVDETGELTVAALVIYCPTASDQWN